MAFVFATCERQRALGFLQKLYPNGNVTEESAKDMLDLIEADVIRVLDPDFHRGGAMQGKNWDNAKAEEYTNVMRDFNVRHLPEHLHDFARTQKWDQ